MRGGWGDVGWGNPASRDDVRAVPRKPKPDRIRNLASISHASLHKLPDKFTMRESTERASISHASWSDHTHTIASEAISCKHVQRHLYMAV